MARSKNSVAMFVTIEMEGEESGSAERKIDADTLEMYQTLWIDPLVEQNPDLQKDDSAETFLEAFLFALNGAIRSQLQSRVQMQLQDSELTKLYEMVNKMEAK